MSFAQLRRRRFLATLLTLVALLIGPVGEPLRAVAHAAEMALAFGIDEAFCGDHQAIPDGSGPDRPVMADGCCMGGACPVQGPLLAFPPDAEPAFLRPAGQAGRLPATATAGPIRLSALTFYIRAPPHNSP